MVEFILDCLQQSISTTVKEEKDKAEVLEEANISHDFSSEMASSSVKSSLYRFG